uniref:Secreted protein n=1 Tax=Panstrongylus lignarius TaxID=156445 RepID=A0A224Y456_9HEMI
MSCLALLIIVNICYSLEQKNIQLRMNIASFFLSTVEAVTLQLLPNIPVTILMLLQNICLQQLMYLLSSLFLLYLMKIQLIEK